MKFVRESVAVACFCALAVGTAAQQVPSGPPAPPPGKTGNPTPGTPQPDPPNLADRLTLTGCVQVAGSEAAARGKTDPNDPSDSKFVLTKAARKSVVPPGTGTSPAAAEVASATYRLRAIDSQLSPFVGTTVEISGEVLPSTIKADAGAPTLLVEFVQKLSQKCS